MTARYCTCGGQLFPERSHSPTFWRCEDCFQAYGENGMPVKQPFAQAKHELAALQASTFNRGKKPHTSKRYRGWVEGD